MISLCFFNCFVFVCLLILGWLRGQTTSVSGICRAGMTYSEDVKLEIYKRYPNRSLGEEAVVVAVLTVSCFILG